MAISRPLGATSRVIFELKPFEISIRGANGSQPWVGRSTAQMSGNQRHEVTEMNRKQHFSTMENLQKIESCLPIDTL